MKSIRTQLKEKFAEKVNRYLKNRARTSNIYFSASGVKTHKYMGTFKK